jgi:hypothetical protein
LHGVERVGSAYDIIKSYETQGSHRGAQLEGEEVLDIIEYALALLNSVDYRGEVIVKDYHGCSLFCYISSWRGRGK